MDEETKMLLKESVQIGKENNDMLKVLIRGHKINMISRGIYWAFIILSFIGAGIFLKSMLPSLTGVLGAYTGNDNLSGSSVQDVLKNTKDLRQTQQELIDALNK